MEDFGADMDDMFQAFMGEVDNIKSEKQQKMEKKFSGTPDELVERLTTKIFTSSFDMLGIAPDATEQEITKVYRKMSFMIHPDKCKHANAHDAFQVLAKAYKELKDPAAREKYQDVIKEARAKVTSRRAKENKKRSRVGKDPLEMEGKEYEEEVTKECDRLLHGDEGDQDKSEYAMKTREANEKRMNAKVKTAKGANREWDKQKRDWEKTRDHRVAGWQQFVDNVSTKKFKSGSMAHIGQVGAADIHHMREERSWHDDIKNKLNTEDKDDAWKFKKAAGLDDSYKKAWR